MRSFGRQYRTAARVSKTGGSIPTLTSTTGSATTVAGAAECMAMHSVHWSGSLSTGWTCATWMTARRAAKTRHNRAAALKARGFERLSLRNCVWNPVNSAS